eukprot:1175897-Prorocentrum_minimum.AAC.2
MSFIPCEVFVAEPCTYNKLRYERITYLVQQQYRKRSLLRWAHKERHYGINWLQMHNNTHSIFSTYVSHPGVEPFPVITTKHNIRGVRTLCLCAPAYAFT